MRILFLDDSHQRIAIFKAMVEADEREHQLVIAENAADAIQDLKDAPFDWVFLDHDLEHGPFRPFEGKNTGSEVARFIENCRFKDPEAFLNTRFVIHSNNPGGCAEMFRLIGDLWFKRTLGNLHALKAMVAPFGTWIFKNGAIHWTGVA